MKGFVDGFYKDFVIVTYADGSTSLMSLQEFNNKGIKKNYWFSVTTVQSAPNTKLGLGKFFKFTFSPVFFDDSIDEGITKQRQDKNLPPLLDFLPEIK